MPEVYSTAVTMWDADLDKPVQEDVYIPIPFEGIDSKVEAGSNPDDWCSLPEKSSYRTVKEAWIKDHLHAPAHQVCGHAGEGFTRIDGAAAGRRTVSMGLIGGVKAW